MGIIGSIIDWVTTPYTIWLIMKQPDIPKRVKWRAAIGLVVIIAYIASPLDFIPDVIPLTGWLDDIVIVPIGFAILRWITPEINILEKREKAEKGVRKIVFWVVFSIAAALLLAMALLALAVYGIVKLFTG